MDKVIPGLYASAPEPLPFDSSIEIRAFLLRRDRGNLLIYSAGTLEADVHEIEGLGGISRHYLNHRHEAAFGGCDRVADTFDVPLFCHENERRSVSGKCNVAGTFSERHMLDDDFEVIPTPGHTSGTSAFLWDTGRHRFLFTSDTIYFREGEWIATVLDRSDRGNYIESLELIRDLDFDVLVPWAAPVGQPYHALTGETDARRRIDLILERVRRGEDR